MTVIPYALDGMSPARVDELGIEFPPDYMPRPNASGPCVGLYSDRLNQWSTLYEDDGTLSADAWLNDVLYAADNADQVADSLATQLDADLTANLAFLARTTFPSAAVTDQVKALTRQIDALIRIERGLLDSTQGT